MLVKSVESVMSIVPSALIDTPRRAARLAMSPRSADQVEPVPVPTRLLKRSFSQSSRSSQFWLTGLFQEFTNSLSSGSVNSRKVVYLGMGQLLPSGGPDRDRPGDRDGHILGRIERRRFE